MPLYKWTGYAKRVLSRIQNNEESLTHLEIRVNGIDYWGAMDHMERFPNKLAGALQANTVITSMEIELPDYYSWDGEDFNFLKFSRQSEALAKAIGGMVSLQKLTINDESSPNEDAGFPQEQFKQVVAFFLKHVRQITRLKLTTEYCDSDCAGILDQALGSHPALEDLTYIIPDGRRDFDVYHFPFPTSLSTLPKLRSLYMESFRPQGSDHATRLLGLGSSLSTLCTITINDLVLDEPSAICVAGTLEQSSNLSELQLTCPPNDLFFDRLAQAVKDDANLTKLKIWLPWDHNGHSRESAMASATYSLGLSRILTNMNAANILKSLSIRKFHWDETQHGLLNLVLENTTTLEKLSLEFMEGLNDETWVSFGTCVGRNTTLNTVHVEIWGDPSLSDEALLLGHTTLAASPNLTDYSFLMRKLPYELILSLLGIQSRIARLEFRWCEFDTKKEMEMINHLKTNYTISELIVYNHGRPILHPLQRIIQALNSYGRLYMVNDRGAKAKGVALLAAIAAAEPIDGSIDGYARKQINLRLDCLYYHLSENPSLCE